MGQRMVITTILVLLAVVPIGMAAPHPPGIAELFQQLQVPTTTNQAAQQLLELGRQNTEVREFLAGHLPGLVAKGPVDPADPWLNEVHLVGELKIGEAAPALEKWIGLDSGGTITLTMLANLENKPVGKALAEIGDPALPTLIRALQHPSVDDREVATKALRLIGSSGAKEALQSQLTRETDPRLRNYIKKILDQWKP